MSFKSDATFDRIAARVAKITAEEGAKVKGVFQFNITQDGKVAKQWILDLNNKSLKVGKATDPISTIIMSDDSMAAMGAGTLKAKDAIDQSLIDMEGNIEAAIALGPYISEI